MSFVARGLAGSWFLGITVAAVLWLESDLARADPPAGGINRMTNSLPNPINFQQYGQMTGVGPIRGTVRIYNQFGPQQMSGNSNPYTGQGGQGGGGSGGGGSLPGVGATQGDDPPQGVLLHVNYAQMFLPSQPQQNNNNFNNPYGRFPGFGAGFPGGFGGYPYGAGFPGMPINGGQAMLRPFP
ncbi:hypothetical protein AYO44_17660 [Planctomycetaceae bacterium SCGC AG-212-F19]|nr:hypothetical protein AYO44_17660 [Planctomycetaceae bacterium SCGC AG-212-F19]